MNLTSQVLGLFDRQIEFIDSLQNLFFDSLRQSIEKFDFVITDYIVNKQLFRQGIDGNNKKLKGYERTTINYKIRRNQPIDRTTLMDEGYFHESVTIDAYDDRFEVSSDVNHATYLIKRYGQDILKPSKENMKEFFEVYYIPQLKQRLDGKLTR